MINRVGTVTVFVSDQDRAKDFYTNVLGFELRASSPLFPGATARWLAVAPEGAATEITLYLPDENWAHYQQVVREVTGDHSRCNGHGRGSHRTKRQRDHFCSRTGRTAMGNLCYHPRL